MKLIGAVFLRGNGNSVRNTEGILTDGKTEMNAGGEKQPLTQTEESAWRTFKTGQE